MFICNAFSLNMLENLNADVAIRPISADDVRDFHEAEGLESAVGHPDTAAVFSRVLGFDVPTRRVSLALGPGDRLVVGQYLGPRLAAGATELPEGARIEWALVVISEGRFEAAVAQQRLDAEAARVYGLLDRVRELAKRHAADGTLIAGDMGYVTEELRLLVRFLEGKGD